MSEPNHCDISAEPVASQNESTVVEQGTMGEAQEVVPENVCGELSVSKQQFVSEVVQKKSAEPDVTLLSHNSSEESYEQQPVSKVLQNESAEPDATFLSCNSNKELHLCAHIVKTDSGAEKSLLPPENEGKRSPTARDACPPQTRLEESLEHGSNTADMLTDHMVVSQAQVGTVPSESVGQKDQLASEITPVKVGGNQLGYEVHENEPASTYTADSKCDLTEKPRLSTEAVASSSLVADLTSSHIDATKIPCTEELGPSSDGGTTNLTQEQFKTPLRNGGKNSGRSGGKSRQNSKFSKKKYPLRSLVKSDRVLRSRSQEKPQVSESHSKLGHEISGREKKTNKRKRKGERKDANEFSRTRRHLRYLLHRISREQLMIDTYSSEGWKGLSLEKLKPEKELQKAKSEINRCKLKIRGLFQRIELLSADGRLPASAFDSDGEIDGEAIFCAKCGSKDLSADNDIILCDGACDRAFHQYCLEPPLLKEDIPSGSEGWLCPACDCKVDCLDLIDDLLGINLSITDSWEKVFPEAAGGQQSDNIDLQSDDSDDDYNPDGPDSDENNPHSDSSSDDSDYASASENSERPPNGEQSLGLPSEESDDEDYDPDAPDPDLKEEESSSSDFTSASEDLGATVDSDKSAGIGEAPKSFTLNGGGPPRGSYGSGSKFPKNKPSLKDELLSLQESESGQEGSEPLCGKRHAERLDYKKLYDETYGNVPSSSSEDEDWSDTGRRNYRAKNNGSARPNRNIPGTKGEMNSGSKKHGQKRMSQEMNADDSNNSPSNICEGSSQIGSSGKRAKSSAYKRLEESVTKSLYKSFKENQYPDRATKERLANELGLTVQKVSKWFENARWCLRHSSQMEANLSKSTSEENKTSPQPNDKHRGTKDSMTSGTGARKSNSEGVRNEELMDQEGCKETPTMRRSSRIKGKQDQPQSNRDLGTEEAPERSSDKLQTGERALKRRRKSTA